MQVQFDLKDWERKARALGATSKQLPYSPIGSRRTLEDEGV